MTSVLVTLQFLVLGFLVLVRAGPCYHGDSCHHNTFDLAGCVAGDYRCQHNEVCVLVVSGHDTKADCQDKANMHDCENKMHHNDPHCDPATGAGGQHECHYCCADDQCMKGLAPPRSTQATLTPPVPQTAPKGSCYTSPCHHGDDFATCSSGDWGCGSDQYCNLHFGGNGDIHMDCHARADIQHCQTGLSHNHGQCDPYVPGQGDCRYCCLDEDCINSNVLGLQPANTTAAASTSAEPCVDEYTGDCSVDFAGQCSDPIVMKVCERTCGICDCTDNYHGTCTIDFAGQCDSPIVQKICPRTCKSCHTVQAAKTTTPATVPADDTTTDMATTSGTTDITTATDPQPSATTTITASTKEPCHDTYLGDCLTEFSGQCTDSIVREVCKKSCGVCSDTTATSTAAAPTAAPSAVECTDRYFGDCATVFPGQCDDPIVSEVCQESCNLCTASRNECRDMHTGNCTLDFPNPLPCWDRVVAFACQRSCGKCPDSTQPMDPMLG